MDYITTYTGIRFTPSKVKADNIIIEDIAHALSLLCRGNGHIRHFFSVAQHSINCALEAEARGYSKRVQLGCLLHDASEAYLSDITRPVKQYLPEYLKLEGQVQNVIFDKFISKGLMEAEIMQVQLIDDDMLYYELEALLFEKIKREPPIMSSKFLLTETGFKEVEASFLEIYNKLAMPMPSGRVVE